MFRSPYANHHTTPTTAHDKQVAWVPGASMDKKKEERLVRAVKVRVLTCVLPAAAHRVHVEWNAGRHQVWAFVHGHANPCTYIGMREYVW